MSEPNALRLLDQYDRVVAAAADHVPPVIHRRLARIGADLRERRLYDGPTLVGLAGGTGSGKSSLLNALAGEEISVGGAIRPTTSQPVAWVPAGEAHRLAGLWERVGLKTVVTYDQGHGIVLIDLPDVDSLEVDHQRIVEELLAILDVVVWVVDPEKYGDEVLHRRFLAPRATQATGFRFVLNQIDRLTADEVEAVRHHLLEALRADGITAPVLWATAADPESGPPLGIEQVREGLFSLSGEDLARRRLLSELRRGIGLLAPYTRAVGFTERWEVARRLAAERMPSRPDEAVRVLKDLVLDLSTEGAGIDRDLDVASIVGHPTGTPEEVARRIDLTLGRLLRDDLRQRATIRALADELLLMLSA
ncbi:MAG TPA: GTPase [Acidimicrobiia bacterium]|nr:GTPase [Acidimicrobiia bacterium]